MMLCEGQSVHVVKCHMTPDKGAKPNQASAGTRGKECLWLCMSVQGVYERIMVSTNEEISP